MAQKLLMNTTAHHILKFNSTLHLKTLVPSQGSIHFRLHKPGFNIEPESQKTQPILILQL